MRCLGGTRHAWGPSCVCPGRVALCCCAFVSGTSTAWIMSPLWAWDVHGAVGGCAHHWAELWHAVLLGANVQLGRALARFLLN